MENTSAGPVAFLKAKGPLSQIVLAVIIATVLYIILLSLEIVYISYIQVANTKVDIVGKGGVTLNSSTPEIYTSNTNLDGKDASFRDLRYSDNEKTGIEYSYSCFLNISPDKFSDGTKIIDYLNSQYNKSNLSKEWVINIMEIYNNYRRRIIHKY